MSGGSIPYIGSKISLISKSEIRYEGILYTIDTKEKTVALQNVRSFGTEGRRADKNDEVAATNDVYDYIIFRGSDIKDLHVCEAPQQQAPPQTRPNDPAIIAMPTNNPNVPYSNFMVPNYQYPGSYPTPYGYGSYYPQGTSPNSFPQQHPNVPQQSQQQPPQETRAPTSVQEKPTAPVQQTPAPQVPQVQQAPQPSSANETKTEEPQNTKIEEEPSSLPQQSNQNQPSNQNQQSGSSQSHQTRGGYYRSYGPNQGQRYNNYNNTNNPNRRNGTNPPHSRGSTGYNRGSGGRSGSSKVLEEFDFESSNAKFDKEKIKGEFKIPEETKPAYDKAQSFFDNISSDISDRPERLSRKEIADQRQRDVETFGSSNPHRGGYYHHRGSGGRDYYRGSNNPSGPRRGSYNSNPSSSSSPSTGQQSGNPQNFSTGQQSGRPQTTGQPYQSQYRPRGGRGSNTGNRY